MDPLHESRMARHVNGPLTVMGLEDETLHTDNKFGRHRHDHLYHKPRLSFVKPLDAKTYFMQTPKPVAKASHLPHFDRSHTFYEPHHTPEAANKTANKSRDKNADNAILHFLDKANDENVAIHKLQTKREQLRELFTRDLSRQNPQFHAASKQNSREQQEAFWKFYTKNYGHLPATDRPVPDPHFSIELTQRRFDVHNRFQLRHAHVENAPILPPKPRVPTPTSTSKATPKKSTASIHEVKSGGAFQKNKDDDDDDDEDFSHHSSVRVNQHDISKTPAGFKENHYERINHDDVTKTPGRYTEEHYEKLHKENVTHTANKKQHRAEFSDKHGRRV